MLSLNIIIIISIGIVSYFCFQNRELFNKLLFSPYVIIREKQWYRFFTSAWVHGDMTHLIFNLFTLYFFGELIESYLILWFGTLGKAYYLFLFLASVIIAHIPTYIKQKDNYAYSSIGASGGVSGVLFASIILQPLHSIYFFGIIPIPGIVFGVLYLVYTHRMTKQSKDNINHDAHLWGAFAGILIIILYKPAVVASFIEQLTP